MSGFPLAMARQAPSGLALNEADLGELSRLLGVWAEKRYRNQLRNMYVAGVQPFEDLAIALPPSLKAKASALMWPEIAVTALTDMVELEGVVAAGQGVDPWGLSEVLDANRLLSEVQMAARSAAIHACAFLTVSQGDVASGEPGELVLPRAADMSAAVWDPRRRRIASFLAVTDVDELGTPTSMTMYLPEKTTTLTRRPSGQWQVDVVRNPLGEPTVFALPHKADLERPFGRSRVTRALMSYTDAAVRTMLRGELSAELYASPQYWVEGRTASEVVGGDKWKAAMGRIFGLSYDEDNAVQPSVKRFEGSSQQPHVDHLRQWAAQVSADSGVPLSALGITTDNPASAEAIFAEREPLMRRASAFTRSMTPGVAGALRAAVRLRDGRGDPELRHLRPMWTDPALTSPATRADAFVKVAQVVEGFADTEVGLEYAGLSREQIVRLRDEKRRAGGSALLDKVLAARGGAALTP